MEAKVWTAGKTLKDLTPAEGKHIHDRVMWWFSTTRIFHCCIYCTYSANRPCISTYVLVLTLATHLCLPMVYFTSHSYDCSMQSGNPADVSRVHITVSFYLECTCEMHTILKCRSLVNVQLKRDIPVKSMWFWPSV